MPERTKILIVDDEQVMRDLLTDILANVGYSVKAVESGEKALEEVKKEKYAIVLTDYRMPGINGVEVIKQLKKLDANICIILVTAFPSVETAIDALREGAYDYIIKPFNIQEIELVIHRAVERHYLLKEAQQKEFYRELSILDGLTGIYNHRYFHEILSQEIERANLCKQPFCLLIIDLDNFKNYNDKYRHLAGDDLLRDFGRFFVENVRDSDMVFRYGGDEFAIILPKTIKQSGIEISKQIINFSKQKLPISITIGLSTFPDDAKNKDTLIEKADEMLYRAKQLGKCRIGVSGQNENKKINILVVDDEQVICSLFTDILTDQGYNVTTVKNGKEAIEKVKESFYHIAFIDIHMPVMNGIEALKAIKKISPKTSIVMMDSYPNSLVEDSKQEGAVTCLGKPFNIHEVTNITKEILGQK